MTSDQQNVGIIRNNLDNFYDIFRSKESLDYDVEESITDISKQILEGIDLKKNVEIILNRREAISKGVNLLDGKSTLLVLGKGHEKFQEIGDKLYEFDDIEFEFKNYCITNYNMCWSLMCHHIIIYFVININDNWVN